MIQRSDLYSGSLPQTGSGYRIWEGLYIGEPLKIGSSTYPTNSFDGTYKHVVWKSIDRQFYRFPFDPIASKEHTSKRFNSKFLNYSASIFSIPYMDMGEKIKPGSLQITGSGFNLTDDQNGNIYDVSLSTGSYTDKYNLVAYWGFNDEFRKTKNTFQSFEKVALNYNSSLFEVDKPSTGKNVQLMKGVPLNLTGSGAGLYFPGNGVVITDYRNEFNFTKDDDFTISFWTFYEPLSDDPSVFISKNTVITEQVYGLLDHYNQNDQVQKTYLISSSTSYKPTDIYPYRFEARPSGILTFKRSDGTTTCTLSGSSTLEDGKWHHVAAVKSGSNLYLYQDGILKQSGSEVQYNPINNHNILFGSDGLNGETNSLLGNMDEIRFYNKGLDQTTIRTLCDSSSLGMYQSSIVGNVFYRSGNVVVSSLNPKYNKIFEQDFTLKYEGTHRIYDYECLVRIPKGSFNLTYNPTAKKGPFTDLIIDEMTGSLSNGACFPYATEIGLYNDKRELLAVAKLNQPLNMRDDVDISLLVSFHG